MKLIFIINPLSGSQKYQTVVDEIKLYKQSHPNFEYDLVLTQQCGHAKEIAATYRDQEVVLVACGGDGTLNEVINGASEKNVIANIPIGSANDFLRGFQLDRKTSLKEWVISTIEGKFVKVDLGIANEEKFINSCNMGIDTAVLLEFNKMRKQRIPRDLIYVEAAIVALTKRKKYFYTVEVNQERFESELVLLTIMNGQYYGGGFNPTPSAKLQDGVFDLCYALPLKNRQLPSLLLKYKKGTHTNHSQIRIATIKQISIKANEPFLYALDGELRERYYLDVMIKPGGLRMLVPQAAKIESENS